MRIHAECDYTLGMSESDREPRIYVLPNLMTAGNLLSGFMAILHIVGRFQNEDDHSRYLWAIGFILAACVFDLLDGRLARLSGQSSDFGREFDSLADIVSFGIAPALLVHDIVLKEFEEMEATRGLGWLIACIYLVCGAMRLARFNCLAAMPQKDKKASTSFRGCPIPAAAGVIVSLTLMLLWLDGNNREIGRWKYALPFLMVLLSYLMVSKIEYPSFKSLNLRARRSFHWVLISIIVLALTVAYWQWMPSVLFVSYLGYGLVRPWVSRKWRREIEEGNDPALDESGVSPEVIEEERRSNGSAKTDPASLI
ncbi:CDP-diacylglycerol--serine O-phosphatidyltransferase [Roseimicrobium gellanilyticum]|uniref:CDP-diacylglycerol--serine O-phosphatidyltransferase n=1 Tax=Roseimicrobium gellanilyticum TaxID=748857 RepID=A0A366HW82_9BACT|nr:CDP-diacylglycerol--serine O-phosphatidyltransferase [Roseimicrobium gellanilyticum]RBP47745.1 CDP-diacylglycerol--serine O-phosphatidyltransferase [Roseimicrobium gellanilyticum]